MIDFKIKRCGYPGCKKPASYECSCRDRHPEDVEGWATKPKVTKHPRYVCEEHSREEDPSIKLKCECGLSYTVVEWKKLDLAFYDDSTKREFHYCHCGDRIQGPFESDY